MTTRPTLQRRLLAMLGTALVWAVAWVPFAIAFALYRASQASGGDTFPFRVVVLIIGVLVLWGAVSGFFYALILTSIERHRSLSDLPLGRAVRWGALGSVTLPAILMLLIVASSGPYEGWLLEVILVLLVSGALGAACAGGTLVLARRAPPEVSE